MYSREEAIVESGHNEGQTKSAVEEVGQRQVENQDCLACVQLRDFIWVPFALFWAFNYDMVEKKHKILVTNVAYEKLRYVLRMSNIIVLQNFA